MNEQLTHNLNQTIKAATLKLTPLPLCPDISLYLISEDYPKGRLPDEEMLVILNQPAYWAFCWASGQVLARYLLEHPALCQGKTVLDLGAGSGVVAIAAAKAGAASVIACDLDPQALDASRINGKANQADIGLLDNLEKHAGKVDLLIAADVLYDRENIPWLERLGGYANEVLIADSRIRDRSVFRDYELIGETSATTIPDLDEQQEFGQVSIYYRRFNT